MRLGDAVTTGAESVTVATEEVAEDPSHATLTMVRYSFPLSVANCKLGVV